MQILITGEFTNLTRVMTPLLSFILCFYEFIPAIPSDTQSPIFMETGGDNAYRAHQASSIPKFINKK